MTKHIFLNCAPEDDLVASLFETRLASEGYSVFRDHLNASNDPKRQQELQVAVKGCLAMVVLVSTASASSQAMMRQYTDAMFFDKPVIPVIISNIDTPPALLQSLQHINAMKGFELAFAELLAELPAPKRGLTFGEAKEMYLNRATLKSAHTVDAYKRAIEQFFEFLEDRAISNRLPIQQQTYTIADELLLNELSDSDAPILLHFAQWLLTPSSGRSGDNRPYKETTVELRVSGVQNWFQYLDDYGWLPPDFPLSKARRMVRDALRNKAASFSAPRPPEHIDEVIYYYDRQTLPKGLQKPDADPDRIHRWTLTRLRNRALLHTLAETGGRISEVLSLNIDDFPVRYLQKTEVLRVEVIGKGSHNYYLRFLDSLPVIRAYIQARGADLKATRAGKVPLFVSHDLRFDGNRMSRVVAWRVVQRAARALGLKSITPHDFRHWRATQLINDGHALDVVQEYLGHRSVETTRAYYAHTDPLRVDNAAKHTGLPDPEDM